MPTAKQNAQAALWAGKIYLPGGFIGSHLTENAIYDIATNTWTTGAPLPAARSGMTAAYNGKIYVVGGNPLPFNNIVVYDIATNTWTTAGATLPVGIAYGRAITVGNYIYIVGGIAGGTTVGTVYRYDPVADTITNMAPLQQARTWEELMSDGTRIFAIAGGGPGTAYFNGVPLANTTEIYDIATNTWTYGNPVVTTASSVGGGLASGKLMIMGGVDGTTYYNTVQVSVLQGGGGCPTNTPAPTSTTQPTTPPTTQATSTRTNTAVPPTSTRTNTATNTAVPPSSTSTSQPPSTFTSTPTATSTVCPLLFTDVPPEHTFYESIRCLACRQIINGYSSGCETGNPCFRPGNNVTRGQVAKMASNSAGFSEPAGAQQYQDVPPGHTFYDFIWRLTDRGLVNGYPCGGPGEPCVAPGNLPYFRPGADVTRGQLSKIVANAAGLTQPPGAQQYQDVPPGHTFYDFIWRLTALGVMQGYPCGGIGEPCVPPGNLPYFRPGANATRGQTSKIVANTFFPECSTP
jgi:hypothetical protein